MFEKTEIHPRKTKLMVRLCLGTGEEVEGAVFVRKTERLADLLNDDRAFVPLDLGDGRIEVIAKTAIASATAFEQPAPEDGRTPWQVLRIEPTASNEDVRAAWMRRLKACHPDRLASLDLDPEIVHTARAVSQRINAAYDEVMRMRRGQKQAG